MSASVLLVDDDRAVREALGQTLELAGLKPVLAGSYIEAKDHIAPGFDGVVVSDIRMPGKDGFDLLAHVQTVDADLPVIFLTGEGDIPMAVRGMAAGAFEFLEKPCGPQDLLAVVEKALSRRARVLENRRLRRQAEQGDAAQRLLVGQSRQAEDLRAQARAAARTQAEVLILGEAGTGTSKLAEVIHLMSGAATRPFVKLPAPALTPGDVVRALGEAGTGTLFLDEICGLDPAAQFTLVELLDESGRARVIAGSTRDLEAAVAEGRMNADLYYRLDVMRVRIPPLRERAEDIPALFRHFVAQACEQAALPVPDIGPEVTARLMAQDWPGNSRSLMNAAMRFALGLSEAGESAEMGLVERMAQVERSLLIEALTRHRGAASETARALKLPRKTFYDKLARHGIRPEDYRR
ncbi:sigma-54-dependent transcriptional regulator [Maritimibacter fusiformis]|uniref:Sigma-54-dependent Fis family transcriptional regulator n=1 Tax=Maritimibacter fusiformis TaxID=2603819 RepID=A0A5D0RPA3_9RHOB|nr:sigma-54 dependent transcriptional regulator [Maritimibacter fusiformis]TYB82999.1 sigma-54-dependent Fis family transcriptional regulator [Maritimibacter fusiformis]